MYRVILTSKSLDDLERIEGFIAMKSSAATAQRYVSSIRRFCETLRIAPHRGEPRAHLRKGLRSIGFKKRVSISFRVSDSKKTVSVARIWYAGYQGKSE
jgi:plasmid stabilization system protein ParE